MTSQCKCGNHGGIAIDFEPESRHESKKPLITIKNRLCCPLDESPLMTVFTKNLDAFKFEVVCKACNARYGAESE
jgi:uncharacterized protein YbaR (Trm112 family)